MALAESLPPDASTASTGLGLRYIGDDHCYAFSGVIASAGSQSAATTTTLLFTSGSSYAKVRVTFSNDLTSASANEFYLIKMNGLEIYKAEQEHNLDTVTNPTVIHLIIPPLTDFESLVGSSGDPMDTTTIISGRVYGTAK